MPLPLADNGKLLITGYIPNLPLAIIGTVVFALLSCAFLLHFFRYYKHRYTLWITIGTLLMVLGFIVRIIMSFSYNATSIPIYSISTLLILVAPCAFIAQNYYVLPKMAEWLDEALRVQNQSSSMYGAHNESRYGQSGNKSNKNDIAADCLFLKSRFIGRIFLTSDVVTFITQLAGSGMTAVQSIAEIGDKIVLVGLVAQLITFTLFIILLIYFAIRVRSLYRDQWTILSGSGWKNDWRAVFWATLWTCPCIMIRCVFRVIEFTQGYAGKLRTTEWYFYVFDTLPLVFAISVWVFIWPSKYFGRSPASLVGAGVHGREQAVGVGMGMAQLRGDGGAPYQHGDRLGSDASHGSSRSGSRLMWNAKQEV